LRFTGSTWGRTATVVGLNATGQVITRQRIQRDSVIKLAAGMTMDLLWCSPPWSHRVRDHGHQVRLISPEHVRPYLKAQKNDDRDAEGIAEAAMRPTTRFVELQSVE
jgi:transposase